MSDVQEAADGGTSLNASLRAGLGVLSGDQVVQFIKFVKLILPLDGSVFWVRASLLSPSAMLGAAKYNAVFYNQPLVVLQGANVVDAPGSLHHSIVNRQDQDQSVAVNRMVFTSEVEITDLNDVSPHVMYMAHVDGERFSFSERRSFYKRAGLYHYAGDAVYPTMESQIIDAVEGLDMRNVIVSNSLPIWLTLNEFMPMYPSYLVPDNLPPPFGVVHIGESDTRALQAVPLIDARSNHWQLAADRVKITMYGLRNFSALDFQDYVNAYSLATDNIGIMNCPIVKDAKQWQTELSALAMKKTIDYEVSYYQGRVRDVARQYIKRCIPHYFIGAPNPSMIFPGDDVALPYEGPFGPGEQLPTIVFLNTTVLERGVAYTESTGDGVFSFLDLNGDTQITVTCTAGNHYPQIAFPNGPATFYINQVLRPFAPPETDPDLLDLSITFGSVPWTQ